MAPTMEVESTSSSSASNDWTTLSEHRPRDPAWSSSAVSVSTHDVSITCEICVISQDMMHSSRSVIPEASPVFKATLDKMELERTQAFCKNVNVVRENDLPSISSSSTPSLTPTPASSSSFLTKLKSAFKSSSSVSPHLSPNHSKGVPSLSASTIKTGSARRPASFGGADGIKPISERRASHSEKRVSWADQQGTDHRLYSVRLIRPRLSADTNHSTPITPGHSILRNTGIL